MQNTHKKRYYSYCIFRRGSSNARITNTTKVVHNTCTNKCQLCDSWNLLDSCESIGIISNNMLRQCVPRTHAIFSAEKILQRYNKFLKYANNLLFFCIKCTYFLMLCTKNAFLRRSALQRYNKKTKSARVCTLAPQ